MGKENKKVDRATRNKGKQSQSHKSGINKKTRPDKSIPQSGQQIRRQSARLQQLWSQASGDPIKASEKVFNIDELLENIMIYLPADALFRFQRVCQRFQNMIRTSNYIHETLFLRAPKVPAPTPEIWSIVAIPDRTRAANASPTYICVPAQTPRPPYWQQDVLPVKLNPMLQTTTDSFHVVPGSDDDGPFSREYDYFPNSARRVMYKGQGELALLRYSLPVRCCDPGQQPAWYHMQLCDPPVVQVEVDVNIHLKHDPRVEFVISENFDEPEGLTLGILFRRIQRHMVGDSIDTRRIGSIGKFAEHYEKTTDKGPMIIEADDGMLLYLQGVIFPSEQERKDMEQSNATHPAEKPR